MEIIGAIYVLLYVLGTLIMFWLVLNTMIDKKKIIRYIPFYVLAFLLFIATIFNYLGVISEYHQIIIEFFNILCLLWIYIMLERKK
jgi:Ca2+/Na+ antiporter